jgi:YD repeat-containing protein
MESSTYDGLGRVVRNTSPLDAPVTTSYAGLKTIIEHASTDATPSTRREVTTDSFGRIVRVIEGVAAPATTLYEYDASDRIIQVTDADGVSTKLDHDHRGLRTRISRGLTTFRYSYDANGNRITKEHPHPNETVDAQRHLSSWAFDPLDRVVFATPATLSLTPADLARYGNGGSNASTLYRYDEANHGFGIGRLTSVETPTLSTGFDYSAEGGVTSTQHACRSRDRRVSTSTPTSAARAARVSRAAGAGRQHRRFNKWQRATESCPARRSRARASSVC